VDVQPGVKRGVEATPLVVDGISTSPHRGAVVHAIDVRTGKRLVSFDPKSRRARGKGGAATLSNRGVALQRQGLRRLVRRRLIRSTPPRQGLGERPLLDRTRPYTITARRAWSAARS